MPAALPTSDAIRASLKAHGASDPDQLATIGALGRRVARIRLQGQDWLGRFVSDTPTCGPERAMVATVLWGKALPLPSPVVVLRLGLTVPGALHPLPVGRPASSLEPGPASEAVGRALAAIQQVAVSGRGSLDTATGFAPRAGRWSEEQRELAERDHASAVGAGLDLGALSVALLDRVSQHADALDAGTRAVAVHGRLDPRRVFVDDAGGLSAIVGWERASTGDPEQDWAPIVLTEGFAGVVRGFGSIAALGEPPATARLEAHVARILLEGLANLADDPPAVRAAKQQQLAVWAHALLDGAVARRVADPSCALPAIDPLDATCRRAIHALAERPDPTRGSRAATAVALVGLARHHPEYAKGLRAHADAQLDRVPPAGWPRAVGSRVDRQGWLAELEMLAVEEASAEPHMGQSAAALWLFHEALDRLQWSVSTQVLLGLRAHLFALRAARASVVDAVGETREAGALRGLAHGLLAAAAFQELAGALDHDVSSLQTAARQRLDRAATALDYGALAARGIAGDVASALPNLVEREALEGPAGLLPQLLLALERLGPDTWRTVPAAAVVSLV